jgi:DNA polymerase I-like protein with 3'-5' exonuclease and polymerase domains
LFGFKRYFTLENLICKTLFTLANNPPPHWKAIKGKVVRRDREQTVSGALSSACYAAAFNVQSADMRAAANHEIQCPGAILTKRLQVRQWALQPPGYSKWLVIPMNVHDEILSVTHKSVVNQSREIVTSFLDEYRKFVPLLSMDWKTDMKSWADK